VTAPTVQRPTQPGETVYPEADSHSKPLRIDSAFDFWQATCKPRFNKLQTDMDLIHSALWTSPDGKSISARVAEHSRLIKISISIHLLSFAMLLSILGAVVMRAVTRSDFGAAACIRQSLSQKCDITKRKLLDDSGGAGVITTNRNFNDRESLTKSGGGHWTSAK